MLSNKRNYITNRLIRQTRQLRKSNSRCFIAGKEETAFSFDVHQRDWIEGRYRFRHVGSSHSIAWTFHGSRTPSTKNYDFWPLLFSSGRCLRDTRVYSGTNIKLARILAVCAATLSRF